MSVRWCVDDMGTVYIQYTGFGTHDAVLSSLSSHLERAIALGSNLEQSRFEAYPGPSPHTHVAVWEGRVPLQNVADIREFLMSLTVKDVHR